MTTTDSHPHAHEDVHHDLHVDQGALPGEHPGRDSDPVIKITDLAWLEFQKPDIAGTARFLKDFGFTPTHQTRNELHVQGTWGGAPCIIVRRGKRSKFLGPAFFAADTTDVQRLADSLSHQGAHVHPLPETIGGTGVTVTDPVGNRVRVVAPTKDLPQLVNTGAPETTALPFNSCGELNRINTLQRTEIQPARVQRLGHVVLQTNRYQEVLNWYLHYFGMIVSDFQFYPGQRHRGPVMSFIRCDRGVTPADHHTLALTLGPTNRYVHSAYQVSDLDTLAAGGEFLHDQGHYRSWGIGRHNQGSQIFDYWRDPDGFLVEHFADGDMFDNTLEPGWAPMTASGLSQWGPAATADFMGIKPGKELLHEIAGVMNSLSHDNNEFDLERLFGLLKVART
jgi:hypothetical protein